MRIYCEGGSYTVFFCIVQFVTYVVARPGRELLFTVVSQDEKYKAKARHPKFFFSVKSFLIGD